MAEYIDIDEVEKELISQRDSLFKLVNEKVKSEDCFITRNEAYHQKLFRAEVKNFIEFLRARATANVQEVRHGKWVPSVFGTIICSECKERFNLFGSVAEKFYYCPHCGAKMDKE